MSKNQPPIHGNDRVLLGGGPERPEIEAFLTFKAANQGRSARTIEAYRHYLLRLAEFLGADRELLSATDEELMTFCGVWLNKRGVIARSRMPYVAAVREFFKWAHRTRRSQGNPAAAIEYPKTGTKLPRVISLAHFEQLLGMIDYTTFIGVRDATMLHVLAGCGLRIAGLVKINQGDLTVVDVNGEPRMQLRVTEKGDKDRMVPVPREAEMLLRIYLEHDELKAIDRTLDRGDQVLFVSVNNRRISAEAYRGARRRITARAVRNMIVRYGKRAGVPRGDLHPHAVRHLFGTELAEGGVDFAVRQDLLGHAEPKHTRLYDRMAMRRKFQAADDAGPLAKIKTPVSDFVRRMGAAARSPAPAAASKPRPTPTSKE